MQRDTQTPILILRIYLLLAWVEGIGAFFYTLALGGKPASEWLASISIGRALLLGGILAGIGLFAFLSAKSWRNEIWPLRTLERLGRWFGKAWFFLLVTGVSLAGLILAAEDLLLFGEAPSAVGLRLAPITFWSAALGLQTIIAIAILGYHRPYAGRLGGNRRTLAWAALFLVVVLLIWKWMKKTGIGLHPQKTTWGEPHAPLLLWEVLLGLGFAAIFLVSWKALDGLAGRFPWAAKWRKRVRRTDLVVALGLWVLTAVVWLSVPLGPSGYTIEPQGSAATFYPYADATIYDSTAQNLLIGKGLVSSESNIPRRPMYDFFLFLAHSLVGQDYERVITVQVLVLSIFPGLVYLLGTVLHSRLTGAFIAFLVMVREVNAYASAYFMGGVSHSKAMMTDYPLGVGVALLLLLTVKWAQRPRQRSLYLLLAGGVTGFLMLIRSQVMVFIPLLLLAIALVHFREWKAWLGRSLLLLLGIAILLLPWMWRNEQVAGRFTFLGPDEVGLVEWSLGGGENEEYTGQTEPPGTTPALERLISTLDAAFASGSTLLTSQILPHYLHNAVDTFFVLPASFSIHQIGLYILVMPMWEPGWAGYLPPETLLPVFINLILVAIGLGWAWRKHRLAGILPLLSFLAFSLTTAAVRLSGRRYILPVDWIILIYYGIGIIQCGRWLMQAFTQWEWPQSAAEHLESERALPGQGEIPKWGGFSWRQGGLAVAILIIVAAAPWVSEAAMRPSLEKYAPRQTEQLLNALKPYFPDLIAELDSFSEEESGRIIHGRALYPQVFEAGTIHTRPGILYSRILPTPFDRAGFLLIGPEEAMVLYPANQIFAIPQAAEVIVIGCQEGELVSALAVLVLGEPPRAVFPQPSTPLACNGINDG